MVQISKTIIKTCKRLNNIYEIGFETCSCDKCGEHYTQKITEGINRRKGKIASGKDICRKCIIDKAKKIISEAGTKALKSFSIEDKKKYCSEAGLIAAKKYDPLKNNSRFSKEKWEGIGKEERRLHGKRASNGLQEKLKCPIYAEKHWEKINKQLKIGYQSKGHLDLHNEISDMGFETHVRISSVSVDECNSDLKIVIEYNGDFWHCNPKKWQANDYNNGIKMYAKDKWYNDRKRFYFLKSLGYRVIIVWESDWKSNKIDCLNRIRRIYNETIVQKGNT
mgnify:CR=1 FL=1